MLHRVIFGSIDRFLGILIEHYAGAFPLWLAPEQIRIIPINDKQTAYAQRIANRLRQAEIRVTVDDRNEKMGYRIREAEKEKIPYMAIVGEKEADKDIVALRRHKAGDQGTITLDKLIAKLTDEISTRQ